MSRLNVNKAFRTDGLVETSHVSFGLGQQATITSSTGSRFRTQLPRKCIVNLKPEMIIIMKDDILKGQNPYLVFREKMLDNSYRIDRLEKCPENDDHFRQNSLEPEISISDIEDKI